MKFSLRGLFGSTEAEVESTPTPWYQWHPGTQEYWKARAEVAERVAAQRLAGRQAVERERDELEESLRNLEAISARKSRKSQTIDATLARVREWAEPPIGESRPPGFAFAQREVRAILDGLSGAAESERESHPSASGGGGPAESDQPPRAEWCGFPVRTDESMPPGEVRIDSTLGEGEK